MKTLFFDEFTFAKLVGTFLIFWNFSNNLWVFFLIEKRRKIAPHNITTESLECDWGHLLSTSRRKSYPEYKSHLLLCECGYLVNLPCYLNLIHRHYEVFGRGNTRQYGVLGWVCANRRVGRTYVWCWQEEVSFLEWRMLSGLWCQGWVAIVYFLWVIEGVLR